MSAMNRPKRIGIVAHSAEGGALCFITACREGQRRLGPHMHPEVVVSAIPMGLSMSGWETGDHDAVAQHLRRGVHQVAAAGADFFVCPDNTAHLVLEPIAATLPIPGLHIADAVAIEMKANGWTVAGLLGTEWTMKGPVYPRALGEKGLTVLRPVAARQEQIHRAIFDELCQGVIRPSTTEMFVDAIGELGEAGADCVILGCTEIPLIIGPGNSPLPVLDSTRLLAAHAVREATSPETTAGDDGWIVVRQPVGAVARPSADFEPHPTPPVKLMANDLEVEVRSGTPADVSLLLSFIRKMAEFEKLTASATEESLRSSLFGEASAAHTLLAFVDGQPIGYATYFFSFTSMMGRRALWLDDLFVDPALRSRGIGKALMAYLAGIAVENKCARFEWIVLDWNTSAIDLYKRLGADVLPDWRICRVDEANLADLAGRIHG